MLLLFCKSTSLSSGMGLISRRESFRLSNWSLLPIEPERPSSEPIARESFRLQVCFYNNIENSFKKKALSYIIKSIVKVLTAIFKC